MYDLELHYSARSPNSWKGLRSRSSNKRETDDFPGPMGSNQ